MKTYIEINEEGVVIGWQAGYQDDEVAPSGFIEVDSQETADSAIGMRLIGSTTPARMSDFEKIPEPEPTERRVSTIRFKSRLLGGAVYGGLRVARIGLQAKFSNNSATPEEVAYLTLLEAVDGMNQGEPEIDLMNPVVEQVLDFAVGNPHIGYGSGDDFVKFDENHKARVLADISLTEAAA